MADDARADSLSVIGTHDTITKYSTSRRDAAVGDDDASVVAVVIATSSVGSVGGGCWFFRRSLLPRCFVYVRRDDDPGDDPGDDRGDEPGVNVIVPSLPLPPGLSIIFSVLCNVDGLICFRAAMATSRGDLMMIR